MNRVMTPQRAEVLSLGSLGVTPQDCLFLSPRGGLIGQGRALCSADLPGMTAGEQLDHMRAEARRLGLEPVIMGALPFEPCEAPALLLPQRLIRLSPAQLDALRRDPPAAAVPRVRALDMARSKRVYLETVARALELIAAGEVEKLVLSREAHYVLGAEVDTGAVLQRLMARHPLSYLFSVPQDLQRHEGRGVFLGASPELLVSREGRELRSNPLAGSVAAEGEAARDAAAIEGLLRSEKDLAEHRLTARAVARGLEPFCDGVSCPDRPEVLKAGAVYHLSTPVSGRLREPARDALALAMALHPTPAVGGVPSATALRRIRETEARSRGLYAGMTGWCDGSGNGEWAVSLRCAAIDGDRVRLFAGAGIVAGSDPVRELAETETKLQTMLGALGLTPEALTATAAAGGSGRTEVSR